jgi:Protein of unknown function (DUF1344)
MNKLTVVAFGASLLAMSFVSAVASEANGTITSLDTNAATMTLDSGETFVLPSPLVAASLRIGQKVKVTYGESSDGTLTALELSPDTM